MTWTQCLVICGLLLYADHLLYGNDANYRKLEAAVERIDGYTPAQIKVLADLTEREVANLKVKGKPARQIKPVVRQPKITSKAAWAVTHAQPNPHPESDDWLTIATR